MLTTIVEFRHVAERRHVPPRASQNSWDDASVVDGCRVVNARAVGGVASGGVFGGDEEVSDQACAFYDRGVEGFLVGAKTAAS